MRKYKIKTIDNKKIDFDIEAPHPTFKSCFAFGIYKGGSTLLFNILTAICEEYHQIPYVSVLDHLFMEGFDIRHLDPTSVTSLFAQEGYCFGGFREFPSSWIQKFLLGHKKIILLRDPRDMLVSLFYSYKYSHYIPENNTELKDSHLLLQQIDINELVIERKNDIKTKLDSYSQIDDLDSVKLFRYEDIILSKRQWVRDICDFLQLPLSVYEIKEILNRYDIIPATENDRSHIRRVIPGDYLNKLNPETIEYLNEFFKDFLLKYGYI